MTLINTGILKEPMNWLTVVLMVTLASVVFHLLMKHWDNN